MNRKEIKNEAKMLIKNNLWNLLKPYFIYFVITVCFSILLEILGMSGTWYDVALNQLFSFLIMPLSVGINFYYLKFIRKQDYTTSDMFSFYDNLPSIFLIGLVVSIFVFLGYILLIVPGIIIYLAYSKIQYLMADGNIKLKETLNKSRTMMKGYKSDYFVFTLSFIGWHLLAIITFGIAYIYVLPYIGVADALYYEKLRNLNN